MGELARGNQLSRGFHHFAVHVAKADDIHRRDLDEMKQIGLSIPATADQRYTQALFLLGGEEACFRRRDSERSSAACLQEMSSGHILALSLLFFWMFAPR